MASGVSKQARSQFCSLLFANSANDLGQELRENFYNALYDHGLSHEK